MRAAVLLKTDDAMRKKLTADCPQVTFTWDAVLTPENVGGYEAIIGNVEPELLQYAESLRLLQLNTAGVDVYTDKTLYANPDAVVCSATGAYGLALSEYMAAVHLALLKNLHHYRDSMKKHAWEPLDSAYTVWGSKVLVVGAGNIGRAYARIVGAMGAECIAVRRTVGELPEFSETHTMEELDALLPHVDVVAMVLPGTPETAGVMTRERIFSMKPGSILINAGRGSAVDQEALYDALKSGHLMGAAIDVTEPEPLPEDHPLWTLENLILTPHSAGGLRLRATVEKILDLAAENLGELLQGKRPAREIDVKKGY